MTDHLGRIERALDILLRTAIEDDIAARKDRPVVFTAIPLRDLVLDKLPTRSEIEASSLIHQPIGAACRHGVHRLGEQLFRLLGDIDGMRNVAERVADLDPPKWGYRIGIIDSAWNGIGNGTERWWS